MSTTLIGLSGYAQTGKDTAAQALIDAGWERRAFADKLREMAYDMNPVVMHRGHPYQLARLVDAYGWDSVKVSHDMAREFLQTLGETARTYFGPFVWVDLALFDLRGDVVVTDVRYPDEANEIRTRGGLVIRIERPGVGPVNGHTSETALDGYEFDTYLVNNGSKRDLQESVLKIANDWKASR